MKAEPRLDPVRRLRPRRSTLVRLIAVTMLLVVAAMVAWSGSSDCAPTAAPREAQPADTPSADPSEAPPTPTDGRPVVPRGSVGVPVRLAEPAALSLVRPGDRVDLFRVEKSGGTTPIATAALILARTAADDPLTGGLLIALRPPEAKTALSDAGRGFAVMLRAG
jgi:hypothetical protein